VDGEKRTRERGSIEGVVLAGHERDVGFGLAIADIRQKHATRV
jgi:hypothetical protein